MDELEQLAAIIMKVNVDSQTVTTVNNLKQGIDGVNNSASQTGAITAKTFKDFKKEISEATDNVYQMYQQFGNGSKEVIEAKKRLDELNKVSKDLFSNGKKDVTDNVKVYKNFRQEIKAANQELYNAVKTFGDNSKQANLAKQKIAELTDQQGDLNAQIQAFNPDNKFQGLIGVASGAALALQGVLGGLTAIGVSSDTAQVAIAKLQGVMAFTGALSQIDSIKVSFQGLKSVVTEQLIPSLLTTKGLLSTLGIGAVITGLILFTDVFDGLLGKTKELTKEQKTLNDVYKEGAKGASADVAKYEIFRKKLTDINTPAAERVKIAKDYNEIADETNKLDLKQIDNLTLINAQIDKQNKLVIQRAISSAALNKLTESSNQVIEDRILLEQKLRESGLTEAEVRDKIAKKDAQTRDVQTKALLNNQQALDNYRTSVRDVGLEEQKRSKVSIVGLTDTEKEIEKLIRTADASKSVVDNLANLLNPLILTDDGKTPAKNKAVDNLSKQFQEQLKALLETRKDFDDNLQRLREDANSALLTGLQKELNDIDVAGRDRQKKLDDNLLKEEEVLKKGYQNKVISEEQYQTQLKGVQKFYDDEALNNLRTTASLKQTTTDNFNRIGLEKLNELLKAQTDATKNEFDIQIDTIKSQVDDLLKNVTDPNIIAQLKDFRQKTVDSLLLKREDSNTERNLGINVTREETNVIRTQRENTIEDTDGSGTRINKIKENLNAELALEQAQYELRKLQAKDNVDELLKIEQEHITNKVNINKKGEDDITKTRRDGLNITLQTYSAVGNALADLGTLFKKQTAANKALNVANAVMNTGLAITQIWANKTTLPEPFSTIQKVAATVTASISGINAVKQILSAQTGGSGGGSVPTAPAALQSTNVNLPVTPQDVRVVNQPGQQTLVRAFLVQDELDEQQKKSNYFNGFNNN